MNVRYINALLKAYEYAVVQLYDYVHVCLYIHILCMYVDIGYFLIHAAFYM